MNSSSTNMDNVDHNYSINVPPAANVLVVDLGSGNAGPEEPEVAVPPAHEGPQSPEVVVINNEDESRPAVVVLDDADEEMDVDGTPETRKHTNERQTEKPGNSDSGPRRLVDEWDESDPGSQCMICYSSYDTSAHKLCCLKCGHLFGQKCIEHWLKAGCTHANRKCPTCNTKASLRDIRILYAKTLVATDTSEINRLQKKIEQILNEKSIVESTLKNANLKADLEISMLRQKISEYEKTIEFLRENIGPRELKQLTKKSYEFTSSLVTSTKLSEQGECRVLAHSDHLSLLLATQSSTNPVLFPGYGIRKINTYDMKPQIYIKLHDKVIRDISFGPHERSNLLSVSVDCNAKLFDVQSNTVVQTFKVSEPLWACCWSAVDKYKIFCGSQTGSFYVFDRRQSGGQPEHVIKIPNQKTGIISLCSVPPRPGYFMPNGGILACSLTSVFAFYEAGDTYEHKVLPVEGNFLSMRYSEAIDNILISAKSSTNWKSPRHLVCQLSKSNENQIDILNTHYATRNPSVLSRSTFVATPTGDQLICAYNDRDKTLDAWSMVSDKKLEMRDVYLPDPVLDLCSVRQSGNSVMVPCLSPKNLSVVKFEFGSQRS